MHSTHLSRAHHVLWLGPLRGLGRIVIIVGSSIGGMVLLPGRGWLAVGAAVSVHGANSGPSRKVMMTGDGS